MNVAVTILFKGDGTAVQTAGVETPVEAQVEALAEAGRINRSGVPGAVRGEVWNGRGIVARTFFDPVDEAAGEAAAKAKEEAEAAEAAAKAKAEAEAAEAAAKAKAEAEAAEAAAKAKAEAEAAEAAAKAKAEADKSTPTAPPAASGAGKKS